MDIKVIGSGSSGNSYAVSDGITALLLDAGLPIKRINKALNFKTTELAGALITHEHSDHAKSVRNLEKLGIDLYMSAGTKKGLPELEGSHSVKVVKSKNPFEIGTFRVMPFDTVHDTEEPLGFLLESKVLKERLLYFTDTKYMKYYFSNIHYFLAECNYDFETINDSLADRNVDKQYVSRVFETHMSLETLLEFLKACDMKNARKIYLIHMSKNNADPEKCLKSVRQLTGIQVEIAKTITE